MTQLREVIVDGLRVDLGHCQLDKMFMMITSDSRKPCHLPPGPSVNDEKDAM